MSRFAVHFTSKNSSPGSADRPRPSSRKRIAISLASAILLTAAIGTGTATIADGTPVLGFSYANSTFTVTPIANLSDNNTWVPADGTTAYIGKLTARNSSGALMTNLDVADIVFSATGTNITISAVTNNHDGTYTARYTSTVAQPNSTAAVAYRGVQTFKPGVVCTTTAAITEFLPPHSGLTFGNQPLPTKVVNGVGQVAIYNPAVWPDMGWGKYDPNSPVTVKGVGTPGTTVSISGASASAKCTATVGADGTWSCTMPISAFPLPKLQWTTTNLKTGLLYPGDGYSAWQTFTVTSPECGAGLNVQVGSGYTTPLVIDFSGTGTIATLSADQAPAQFAMGPNGEMLSSGWITPSSGFLVRDLNSNGRVDNIDELFGGNVGDAFNALRSYDTNGDGVIDSKDAGYGRLSVWRDLNSNKVTDPGEFMTVAAAGVVSISLAHTDTWQYDAAGNAVYEHGSVRLTGGITAVMNDVYFAMRVGTALPIPFKAVSVTPEVSVANSTFVPDVVADPLVRATWRAADGVARYTLTITAKDVHGTPIPGLNVSDFVLTPSNPNLRVTAVTDTGGGTYTAYVTSTTMIWSGQVVCTYKGQQIGSPVLTLFI